MIPQYVQKLLIAASSTGLGTLSTAAVATINTSNMDTQRRVTAWTTGATAASGTITIIGTREGGTPVRETITGPASNTVIATTQDFLSITSVSASSAFGSIITLGTNTTGGTQWKPINTHTTPIQVGCYLTLSTTSVIASMEITMDDPTTDFYASPTGTGVAGGLVAAGGQAIPYNVPPAIINCVGFSSVQANTFGALGITSSATAAPGFQVPFWGWRLTLTSSSSTAGNANAAVIQAGIG